MPTPYNYSIANDTSTGKMVDDILRSEIQASAITIALTGISALGDTVEITMADDLSQGDRTLLDGVVSSHVGNVLNRFVIIVQNAINFFSGILVEYAAENITLGITQAGKTKDVADFLADVMRYGQSGSLYEVLNEIEALKTAGLPSNLEPFVTTARFDTFSTKISGYLGI